MYIHFVLAALNTCRPLRDSDFLATPQAIPFADCAKIVFSLFGVFSPTSASAIWQVSFKLMYWKSSIEPFRAAKPILGTVANRLKIDRRWLPNNFISRSRGTSTRTRCAPRAWQKTVMHSRKALFQAVRFSAKSLPESKCWSPLLCRWQLLSCPQQLLLGATVGCVIHHERDVREE